MIENDREHDEQDAAAGAENLDEPGEAKELSEDAVGGESGESGESAEGEAIEEALAELSLDEQLEATRAERDENQDKWQRALADLENYRKRVARDLEESRPFQSLPLARDLLPGLDNLQRALQAAEAAEPALQADLVEGVAMVARQFDEILARHGVEPIAAVGEVFDPAVHEAVHQVPTTEYEPLTVIEEIERGFRLKDRIVRPAKVVVATAPPESDPPADDDSPSPSEDPPEDLLEDQASTGSSNE